MGYTLVIVGFLCLVLLDVVTPRNIESDGKLFRMKRQQWDSGSCPEGQKAVLKENGEYECIQDDSQSSESSESSKSGHGAGFGGLGGGGGFGG